MKDQAVLLKESMIRPSQKVGQCKVDCGSFLHTCVQYDHSPGVVFTHRYVYVDSITPIQPSMLHNKDEVELCDTALHNLKCAAFGVE